MSLTERFVGDEEWELTTLEDYPAGTPVQELTIGDIGIYWQGGRLREDHGRLGAFDTGLGEYLRWREDGVIYEISAYGEPVLGAETLIAIARA
jgi:hypothetical protein